MLNLFLKLNYMGIYICVLIVGFGRKVEKKIDNKKKKWLVCLIFYYIVCVKFWKFVFE